MSAQSSMQALAGSVVGGALGITAMASKYGKGADVKVPESKETGKDIQMAAKARKMAQQKINAIYANKDLSNRAKARRVGKLLDEYKGGE